MTAEGGPGPARSLYLHIPFCTQRCHYCDFAIQVGGPDLQGRYLQALLEELRWLGEARVAAPLESVFLGGGTPSLLRPELLERLLQAVVARFRLAPQAEVTIEANPEGVTSERVRLWSGLGINRVSLGVQSLDDSTLSWLGRSHDADQAELALAAVRQAGMVALSCDLIYAVPGQDAATFERGLRRVLEFQPEHVSCYELTVEPGTPLARGVAAGRSQSPQVEDFLEQRRLAVAVLGEAGLRRYEVSNYARPGCESRHNLVYWQGGAYLAAGSGAHGFLGPAEAAGLGFEGKGVALRYWHFRNAASYARSVADGSRGVRGHEWLTPEDLALERLACGLRLTTGVELQTSAQWRTAAQLQALGLLEVAGGRVRATSTGVDVLDRLTLELAVV
ncbi:MAG: radical SAM family heme chaperone HemW [Candidatus Dormibacteria bacterium]